MSLKRERKKGDNNNPRPDPSYHVSSILLPIEFNGTLTSEACWVHAATFTSYKTENDPEYLLNLTLWDSGYCRHESGERTKGRETSLSLAIENAIFSFEELFPSPPIFSSHVFLNSRCLEQKSVGHKCVCDNSDLNFSRS